MIVRLLTGKQATKFSNEKLSTRKKTRLTKEELRNKWGQK